MHTKQEVRASVLAARDIIKKAQRQGRELTPAEGRTVDSAIEAAEALHTRSRVDRIGGLIAIDGQGRSVGRKMAEAIGKTAKGSGSWSTGPIEVKADALLGKALLSTTGAGSDTAGGDLIQPDVAPGIQPLLFERLTIADLMASGSTTSNLHRYMVESLATNAAAGVAEGAEKPESSIEFDAVDEAIKKIATFLPVTDEMLEDVPSLQSYIDGRLRLFVRIEEEAQLLAGAGGAELNGLLNRIAAPNLMVRSSLVGATDIDHIARGLAVVRGSFLEPDAIVMNPADYERISLQKDADGAYLAGNPFSGDFGRSLFGKRVVLTTAMTEGIALVGAFAQASRIIRRGGLTVEASNSHLDYFRHNKTAIRAEERIALEVSRPAAFATVDLGADSTP